MEPRADTAKCLHLTVHMRMICYKMDNTLSLYLETQCDIALAAEPFRIVLRRLERFVG